MGALPEGFCGTPQQLANAIASRLIIQVAQNNGVFVTGSTAPTSNVGPWLKNCEEWFVWSDSLGIYVPITKGGYNTRQLISATGNFTVPNFIYRLRVHAWGGGGAGADGGSFAGGGGGGGYCSYDVAVIPGQVIAVTIGAGGVHGSPGGTGGNTTFLTLVATGGAGGTTGASTNLGGIGGVPTGGIINITGGGGESGLSGKGGSGGDSPQGGQGGRFDVTNRAAVNIGQTPGGGGMGGQSGLVTSNGGNGGAGLVLVEY